MSAVASTAKTVKIQTFRERIVPKRTWWLVIVGAMVALAFAMLGYKEAADNDMWWMFANGRAILENGIPYTNPFFMHEDMGIVIQQWIPSVIAYLAYSAAGDFGIAAVVLVLTVALYGVAMLFGYVVDGGKRLGAYSLLAGVLIGGCMAYISIRPHLYSMLAFMLVLTVMEKYRRTGNVKFLIALPAIVLVHANMHLSMMPFDLFIAACYLIPGLPRKNCARYDYRRRPILIALAAMAVATFVNPYGLDGVLYLVNSYGAAAYKDYIVELGSTDIWCWYGFYCMVWIIIGSIAIGINRTNNIDWPLTVLFMTCLVLSLQHTRNVWLVAVAGFALFSCAIARSGFGFKKYSKIFADDFAKVGLCSAGLVVILTGGIVYAADTLSAPVPDSTRTPVAAADYLDAHVADPANTKVFTHFNAGGYIEYRGYKVGMDARPELWQSAISGLDKDYYTEYVDMSKNDITVEQYMADKDFDYMIVNTDTKMYPVIAADDNYVTILTGKDYVLFAAAK